MGTQPTHPISRLPPTTPMLLCSFTKPDFRPSRSIFEGRMSAVLTNSPFTAGATFAMEQQQLPGSSAETYPSITVMRVDARPSPEPG